MEAMAGKAKMAALKRMARAAALGELAVKAERAAAFTAPGRQP
jgi:hypothetical protein